MMNWLRTDDDLYGDGDWKQRWMKKLLNYLNVILFQAHQDILSCSRNGLKPAEVFITNIKTWLFIKTSLQWFWNTTVEAILTVQKAELWTATETVNIFETKNIYKSIS